MKKNTEELKIKFNAIFAEQVKKFVPEKNRSLNDFKILYQELLKTGKTTKEGGEECRKIFVNLQAAAEMTFLLLATQKQIKPSDINHVTHTPLPATPLCYTGPDKDIDPNISNDPERLTTVTNRQHIIMALLKTQAWLAAVYLEKNLTPKDPNNEKDTRRTEEGLKRFHELVKNNDNLKDFPILEEKLKEFPAEKIGATAWFVCQGMTMFYSIGAYQANKEVRGSKTWEFVMGEVSDKFPQVKDFWDKRMTFLEGLGVIEKVPETQESQKNETTTYRVCRPQ